MTTRAEIEDLARSKLLGKRIDPVGFVNELLGMASREGQIHCTFKGEESLQFELASGESIEVPADCARGKLRMMCARLSVLCNESSDQNVSLYGGEGLIRKEVPAAVSVGSGASEDAIAPRRQESLNGLNAAWSVRFTNTPSEHEFTIKSSTA